MAPVRLLRASIAQGVVNAKPLGAAGSREWYGCFLALLAPERSGRELFFRKQRLLLSVWRDARPDRFSAIGFWRRRFSDGRCLCLEGFLENLSGQELFFQKQRRSPRSGLFFWKQRLLLTLWRSYQFGEQVPSQTVSPYVSKAPAAMVAGHARQGSKLARDKYSLSACSVGWSGVPCRYVGCQGARVGTSMCNWGSRAERVDRLAGLS